jgi:hypothetical protein
MRESRNYERTHLPSDSYEEWMKRQIDERGRKVPRTS